MNRMPRTESGFVLPTAIFLLVILAALATYMVSLSRTSHISSALDIQGARAYQAARAGIEWAAWRVADPQNPPPNPAPLCPASPTALTLAGTLSAFAVSVSCVRIVETDGADTIVIYQITSTASAGAADEVDFVQRQIQASFSR
jgi:MSHA biogenesis protein MshP